MATTTKTFTFDSTIENWSATPGSADVTMTRSTGDGSPGTGCLSARLAGKNKNPSASLWEWTGTLEALGVPAGATVTTIGYNTDNDYNWRCSEWNTGYAGGNYIGAFELVVGGSVVGTFLSALSAVTGTTTWATENGAAVGSLSYASTQTITLRFSVALRTGASTSGAVTMLIDQVVIGIEYTNPPTVLTVADSSHGHAVDSVILTQAHTLVSNEVAHGHSVDNVVLTQQHSLVVADSLHSHVVDGNLTLTQDYVLVVQEVIHNHLVDGDLILIQDGPGDTELTVQESGHSHLSENINLTQSHVIVIQDSVHAVNSTEPTLTQVHNLTISSTSHQHLTETPTLSQIHLITINDSIHSHTADDSLGLIQQHVLNIDESVHSQISDNVSLTQHHILNINDSLHSLISDNVTLSDSSILLVVADSIHSLSSDSINLSQDYVLTVHDSTYTRLVKTFINVDQETIY